MEFLVYQSMDKTETNQMFFNQIVNAVLHRKWTIHEIPLERRHLWKCYACEKPNAKYELIADADKDGNGEPYWIGTSCAKKIRQITGINIEKAVTKW